MFIVYPDDNNDAYDGPHIYEHGELRPLISAESVPTGSSSHQATGSAESAAARDGDRESEAEADSPGEDQQRQASSESGNSDDTPSENDSQFRF